MAWVLDLVLVIWKVGFLGHHWYLVLLICFLDTLPLVSMILFVGFGLVLVMVPPHLVPFVEPHLVPEVKMKVLLEVLMGALFFHAE